jgi:2-C-methyl-D-erythritol 4-phosphate cytidylyltransferase
MNIALIIAGGSGERMRQDIPKQFIHVDDKPIIIHTLAAFQSHPNIDQICVVCLDGWQNVLEAYAKQFGIAKLSLVVQGGANGQGSIRNGIEALAAICQPDDIVLIHDAIRPLISSEIISDCIAGVINNGSAVTAIPCTEAILKTTDGLVAGEAIDRSSLRRTQTPQAFRLGKLAWAHAEALRRSITNSVASCTMMIELGETVHFSSGSEKNIKITNTEDIEIFKALLHSRKDEWLH